MPLLYLKSVWLSVPWFLEEGRREEGRDRVGKRLIV